MSLALKLSSDGLDFDVALFYWFIFHFDLGCPKLSLFLYCMYYKMTVVVALM